MSRLGLPEIMLLVQYVLAAFGKVPTWHCLPTGIVVLFLYLHEEGAKAREKQETLARELARESRRVPPPPVQTRTLRGPIDH